MKGIVRMCELSDAEKSAIVDALFANGQRPCIRFDPNRDGVGLGRWVVFSAKDSDFWIVHTETLPEAVGICYGDFTVAEG